MLIRIVRLTIAKEKVDEFVSNFETNKTKIRGFHGCERLELLRDIDQPNIYMTYSWWQSENHLNNYRNSELFKGIWTKTKPLFVDKPIAWSVEEIDILG